MSRYKQERIPPTGMVRRSQLITTYGAGALVDLVDYSVIISGTQSWGYSGAPPHIVEPRLAAAVRLEFQRNNIILDASPFRAMPECDDDQPHNEVGIPVRRFPEWMVCMACRELRPVRATDEKERNRFVHDCRRPNAVFQPVRFITMCEAGHVDEFPWRSFAHSNAGETCSTLSLVLEETSGSEMADILVRCTTCGAAARMNAAIEWMKARPCSGNRPWHTGGHEPCEHKPGVHNRTASSNYFAITRSAISIPDAEQALHTLVQRYRDDADFMTDPRAYLEENPGVRKRFAAYSIDRIIAAATGNTTPQPIKPAEFEYLQTIGVASSRTSKTLHERHTEFDATRVEMHLPAEIDRVIAIHQLREVRAQLGFTRLQPRDADADNTDLAMASLGDRSWLPAVEDHGEGIWLQLSEAMVRAWEARPAVIERERTLKAAWDRHYANESVQPNFPGARFYLVHSLAHLLISAIALDAGYPASSIRERIYCSTDPQTPMTAIMLVTTTAGSAGTLGGLVAQATRLDHHLQRAIRLASLCSNDPVCAHHDPTRGHSERRLEGAACHGCLYLAEVSCEYLNRRLDRTLVAPTLAVHDRAFFSRI